jgi:hypothetical protein
MRAALIPLGLLCLLALLALSSGVLVFTWRVTRPKPSDDMMAIADAAGVVPEAPDRPRWARWPATEYPVVARAELTPDGSVRLGTARVHRQCLDARRDGHYTQICTFCRPRLGIPHKSVTS